MPPGDADCHRGARFATGGPKQLAEHEVDPAEATVASSHCGRNRTLAVDLACSGPLAGLKCSLDGRKGCDAGLRPLWAGSPGMQRFDAASCQPGSVEGRRSSCAVGLGLQRTDLPGCDELLGTAVLVQGFGEVLGLAVGKAETFHGFVEFLGLAVSDADIVHGAGRGKITKLYPSKRRNLQNYTRPNGSMAVQSSTEVRAASSPVDSAGRRMKQQTVVTRVGPLAGLMCSLGGRNCDDAGLRPLWAGSPGMQRFNAESCQPGSVESRRSSCAGGLGSQCTDLPGFDEGFRPLRAGCSTSALRAARRAPSRQVPLDRRLSVRTLLAG